MKSMIGRWRVGSLTAGLLLIALGVTLFVSAVTKTDMAGAVVRMWPAVLIALGLELLLQLFVKGDADIKIRYDILSVLFIGFILAASAVYYAFVLFSGIYGGDIRAMFGICDEVYYAEFSEELTDADSLSVLGGNFRELSVIESDSGNIEVDYYVSLSALSSEYAAEAAGRIIKIEGGERARLINNADLFYGDRKLGYVSIRCVIRLPEGASLDLGGYSGSLTCESSLEERITGARVYH